MLHRMFALLAAPLFLAGCCKGREELAVSVASVHELQLTGVEGSMGLHFDGRRGEGELASTQLRALHDGLQVGAGPGAIAFTVSARLDAADELVLGVAVPANLRRGDRYTVAGAFLLPLGASQGSSGWGVRPLRGPDQAEVAFYRSTYTFPPPLYTASFVATHAEGTIDVVERSRGWVQLRLTLRLFDEAGRTVDVSGILQAQAEAYTPPCT